MSNSPNISAHLNGESHRLLYLDGLRGIAALVVAIMCHYVHFSGRFQPGGAAVSDAPGYDFPVIHLLYSYGGLAVDVFFLLSGYVFAAVYADDLTARRVSGREFFVRRFARLYPIHLLTLLATALLIYVFLARTGRFPVYQPNGPLEFVLNILFMQAGTIERGYSFNGPAWSLSFEAMAYLFFFFIAVNGMRLRWVWLAIAVGLALVSFGPTRTYRPLLFDIDTGHALVGFFMGVLVQRQGVTYPVQTAAKILAIGGLSILVSSYSRPAQMPVAVVWAVFGLGLLALRLWPLLRRPLEVRSIVLLGDLSLAIYLVHFPIQVAILLLLDWLREPIPYASFFFLLGYSVIVLVSAYLLHYLFELPAQRWLRRRLSSLRQQQLVIVPS